MTSQPTSSPENEQETEYGLRRRIMRPRNVLSFLAGAAIVALAISRLDLDWGEVASQIRSANVAYLLAAFGAYYGSIFIRSLRWTNLLESAEVKPDPGYRMPGVGGMAAIYMVSWYLNCLLPAKLGDAFRGYLLKNRSRTPFSTALGTVVAERLADMVALAALLVTSGLLVFGTRVPDSLENWFIFAAIMGVAMVVGFIAAFRYRTYLRKLVPNRVMTQYLKLEHGALMSYRRVPSLVALTALIWMLEGLRMYLIGLSIGAGFGVPEAVFIALLASLLTAVPATPAGLGFVEVGIVGAVVVLGYGDGTAASVAVLDRFVAYWSVLVIGTGVFLITRWKWRGEQLASSPGLHSGN